MNFGQNLYNWFLSNAQSLVLLAIVVIGLYLGFKREFSKLIGFLVVSLVAVGLVFNADGVKDILLELFKKGAFMNFGQNLYNWFLSNAQSLVLLAIVVIGLYLGFKREFSKLIGFLVVSLVAVGLVFNADGVKDILLELFNKIIGA